MQLLINIDVPSLEPAIAFYTRAFDFTLARRLFDGRIAELHGANALVHLIEKPAGSPATPTGITRDYARHWTPLHVDFLVDDVARARARALAAGASADGEIRSAAWGRIAVMADPFGHGFCLIELGERGYAVAE